MNDRCYDLVNDKGRAFTAVFEPDEPYEGDPAVSFYDATYDYIPYPGQLAGRYRVSTILQHRGCLSLHMGVPEWMLSECNVLDTRAWLRRMLWQESENSA